MKRRSFILAVFLTVCLWAAACGGLPLAAGTQTNSAGKVRVGVDASLPPFEMDGSQPGEAIGFDVDLINAVAAQSGLNIELVKVNYNQLLPFVENCNLDAGISALAVQAALTQKVNFSDSYFSTGQVVVVKKGNITIAGRESLTGLKVGTQTGSLSELELAKMPAIQPVVFENFVLAIQELAAGNIDAVVVDQPRALSFANVARNDLKLVGDTFGQVDYAVAVCKNQPDLLKKINAGLASLKSDGTLDKLAQKWKLNPAP